MILALVCLFALALYFLFLSPWNQLFGRFVYRVKTAEKIVALTFDDGPSEPHTVAILDILDQHGASGTFFQVGENIRRHPDITRRIATSNHELGNHSLSHDWRKYFNSGRTFVATELLPTQDIFMETVGEKPTLFRPPWLWKTPAILAEAKRQGFVTISGEFGSASEIFQPKHKSMTKATMKKVKPGAIIIFHDGHDARAVAKRGETVAAVAEVVEKLSAEGWKMVTVSELLATSSGG